MHEMGPLARLLAERTWMPMKRWMALGMALVMCLGFVPAGALEGPLQAEVTGEILAADALTEKGVSAANRVLSRLALKMQVWEDGEKASLLIDGREMWQVETMKDENGVHTVFSGATDYVTDPGAPAALDILAGEGTEIHPVSPLAYFEFAGEMYALLGEKVQPKAYESSTTVQNTGESYRYDRYDLTAEEMNGLWPAMCDMALAGILPQGGYDDFADALRGTEFTSDVRIKRLYDRQGNDMGLQVTGNGTVLGTERKISLLYGYTKGKGGSLTVSAKALSGKDSLKFTAGWKETLREEKNTYSFTLSCANTLTGEKTACSLEGRLVQAGESVTGEVTVTGNDGVSWTVSPDVQVTEEKITGSVEIRGKEKKKTLLHAMLQLDIESAPERKIPAAGETVSLRGKTQEEADAALAFEKLVLMRALKYVLSDLTAEERNILTHELRTDNWLTGPRVPVPEDTQEQWIVEEDAP